MSKEEFPIGGGSVEGRSEDDGNFDYYFKLQGLKDSARDPEFLERLDPEHQVVSVDEINRFNERYAAEARALADAGWRLLSFVDDPGEEGEVRTFVTTNTGESDGKEQWFWIRGVVEPPEGTRLLFRQTFQGDAWVKNEEGDSE